MSEWVPWEEGKEGNEQGRCSAPLQKRRRFASSPVCPQSQDRERRCLNHGSGRRAVRDLGGMSRCVVCPRLYMPKPGDRWRNVSGECNCDAHTSEPCCEVVLYMASAKKSEGEPCPRLLCDRVRGLRCGGGSCAWAISSAGREWWQVGSRSVGPQCHASCWTMLCCRILRRPPSFNVLTRRREEVRQPWGDVGTRGASRVGEGGNTHGGGAERTAHPG